MRPLPPRGGYQKKERRSAPELETVGVAAQKAWAALATERRWTLWARLSFAQRVSTTTADKMILSWASQFRHEIRGAALMVGIHNDTDCLHAHALIFIPRRVADPYRPLGVSLARSAWEPWLQERWSFGSVWAAEYDQSFLYVSNNARHSAAADYLARDPGSVLSLGSAPLLIARGPNT